MKKFYKILIILLAMITVGELTLRYIFPSLAYDVDFIIKPALFAPDSVVNYMYIPNLDYTHPQTGVVYHTNKYGYLGTEFPEKSDSRFRIAIVGNSWISGDSSDEYYTTFCVELQRIFDQEGYKVDILNCGIEGDEIKYAIFKSVKYKVVDLEPDVILFHYNLPFADNPYTRENYRDYLMYYALGDDSTRNSEIQIIDDYIKIRDVANFIYRSNIVKVLYRVGLKYGKGKIKDYIKLTTTGNIGRFERWDELESFFSLDTSVNMVKELRDELNDRGIRFSLYTIEKYEKAIDVAREYGLPFMNFNVLIDREGGDVFEVGAHPTKQGNEKIAQNFFETLTKYSFIPEKFCPNN